jgi:membrane-associated phospholipid phosphatase
LKDDDPVTDEPKEEEIGTGEETRAELFISTNLATVIHLFLSMLAVLLLAAGVIAAFDTLIRDFPSLWRAPENEYAVLQAIIENLLLIGIAAEFALLLLFRRMSAVVEVVVFVLARKAVNPEIKATELVLCAVAIAGLIILRYYYLPGRTT